MARELGFAEVGLALCAASSKSDQTLIANLNKVFIQGSETFASASLENGSLKVSSSGDQKGFSLFLGEKQPVQISGAGMELLGFPAAGRRKAALLYHEGDKAAIVAAIVKHLRGL